MPTNVLCPGEKTASNEAPRMTTDVIDITDLVFRWPSGDQLCLDIPCLQVMSGEKVFLHGPSGSGKSTLLGILGGVLVPQHGQLTMLGQNFGQLSASARDRFRADHIGFLFQQFNLIPYLTVIENVLLPCRFSARRLAQANNHDLAQEAQRLLTHLDLTPALWKKPVTQLSVGQQQRVAAARALMGRPEIIIADEPTSALDAERQQAFLDLLSKECRESGSTLLFVSHDHRLATGFDRDIALADLNRATQEEVA